MAPRGQGRLDRVGPEPQESYQETREGQLGLGAGEARIRRRGTGEILARAGRAGGREAVEMAQSEVIVRPRVQPLGPPGPRDLGLVERDMCLERGNQMRDDPFAQSVGIIGGGDQPVCPEHLAGPGLGELKVTAILRSPPSMTPQSR